MRLMLFVFLFVAELPGFSQQVIDVQHYRFELELSDASDAITGSATVRIKFTAPATRFRLDLVSFSGEKGMRAFQVTEEGKAVTFNHSDDQLLVNTGTPVKEGEVRNYEIRYMGIPADGLIISKNKYGDRTFFADNWPNRARHWIPCNDRPDDKASFEFIVQAPKAYQVISNGVLQQQPKAPITGSAVVWHYKEDIPLPTKVMVIGVAKFAVKQFADSPPGLPISAWVYPQDSTKGFYDYALTPQILSFLSSYIAPFPYKKLANVQSKTIFGGMENAGAIFYAEESVTGDRREEDMMAHEIAHQWFGDMASEKSFAHLWLSEGFATYLSHLYFEHKYGRDSMASRLKEDRVKVIAFVRGSAHAVVDSTADLMSLLNANSYQKGSWVLHMLRREVGDSTFRNIIRTYYTRFKGGNAETRDLEKIAEAVSGKELTWFFNQWLYRGGVPELQFKTKTGKDEIKIQIIQGKELYQFTLDIALIDKEGKRRVETIRVTGKETALKLKAKGAARVVMDPDTWLLFAEKK